MLKRGHRSLVRVQLALALALSMLLVPAATQGAVLYDSTPSFGGFHPTIQDFESSLDDRDTLAADDFTVPAGQTWTLERALIDGRDPSDSGPGTTDLANVYLFNIGGTLPQATSFYAIEPATSEGSVFPDFNVALPGAPALGPGTYWFGAQARMDLNGATNNYWVWSAIATLRGNKAAYRNPGDGFASGCTSFSIMESCVAGIGAKPDLSFRLEGTCAGCPVAPTPPAPAPPAKKCKKGQKLKKGKCVKKKKKKKK